MKLQGKNLSLQARRALNSAVIGWLNANEGWISNNVLIAELFSPLKSGALVLLRTRLREHLSHLRVVDKHLPSRCRVVHERFISNQDLDACEWKPLSYPMIGAAMNQGHSTGIKARQKEASRE